MLIAATAETGRALSELALPYSSVGEYAHSPHMLLGYGHMMRTEYFRVWQMSARSVAAVHLHVFIGSQHTGELTSDEVDAMLALISR